MPAQRPEIERRGAEQGAEARHAPPSLRPAQAPRPVCCCSSSIRFDAPALESESSGSVPASCESVSR